MQALSSRRRRGASFVQGVLGSGAWVRARLYLIVRDARFFGVDGAVSRRSPPKLYCTRTLNIGSKKYDRNLLELSYFVRTIS